MGLVAFAALCCLALGLPAAAQASTPPEVHVEPAAVTVTGVQLKGEVNPEGLPTTYYFEYYSRTCAEHSGGSVLNCVTKTAVQGPLTGDTQQEVAVQVTGLEAGQYSYELIAHNADGNSEWKGSEVQFTVGAPTAPLIESESVSGVTHTDATLEAKINPDGLVQPDSLPSGADYQFQIVKNTSEYLPELVCSERGVVQPVGHACGGEFKLGMGPDAIPLGGEIGGGSKGQQVSLDLAGAGVTLQPGTTYHYRVLAARALAEEEGGIFWEHSSLVGPDQTFTTPAASSAPVVDSVSVSHLTATDATLNAQINTEGLSTIYQFKLRINLCPYSECIAYEDIPLPSGLLLGSFETQSVSVNLNSVGVTLKPGFYEYSLTATSTGGSTEAHGGTFEPPEEVVQPVTITTSHGPQLTTRPAENTGQSTITPKAIGPVNTVTPPASARTLTNAQKLAKALKVCAKKPKKQRASCRKAAHKKYGKKATKAK